jgi:protein-tyrosine kinase
MSLYPETTPVPSPFPEPELLRLHQAIGTALPDKPSRVVQFLSCYPREGAGTVASELAKLESRDLDCRTLFVAMGPEVLRRAAPDLVPQASLLDVALGRAQARDAVGGMTRNIAGCDCAYLTSGDEAELLSNIAKLKDVLAQLRSRFDLVVLSTPGALADPVAVQLGTIADAAVLVIEAERTRAPAAQRTLEALGAAGTRLIGIVFNKRRYHIPDWAYRWV